MLGIELASVVFIVGLCYGVNIHRLDLLVEVLSL